MQKLDAVIVYFGCPELETNSGAPMACATIDSRSIDVPAPVCVQTGSASDSHWVLHSGGLASIDQDGTGASA